MKNKHKYFPEIACLVYKMTHKILYIYTNTVQIYSLRAMKSVHSVCSSIHMRCLMQLSQKRRLCAEAHKWVSRSGLQSRPNVICSQCMELFSSFFSDSDSALPSVRAFFFTILTCLLSRAKHRIQKKNETVLKPSVRPRYTILQKSILLGKIGWLFFRAYQNQEITSWSINLIKQSIEGKTPTKLSINTHTVTNTWF